MANFITDAAWVFWFGGLTFYMIVVVPIGGEIVGNDVQGQITSVVTGYLNLASLVASGLILVRGIRRNLKSQVVAASLILATTGVSIALRRLLMIRMSEFMDVPMVSPDAAGTNWFEDWSFYSLHRIYLWIATLQWLCGTFILWGQAQRATGPKN